MLSEILRHVSMIQIGVLCKTYGSPLSGARIEIGACIGKRGKAANKTPLWFISLRVLKILLEHAKADLRPRGMFLNEPFVPVPFCEYQDIVNSNDFLAVTER